MSRPSKVLQDINVDISKVSKLLVSVEDPNTQNALFKLLRILKSWRQVLTMKRREDADDTEAAL
jgi:hypothetical protein